MNRPELARVLRLYRARVDPEDVGMPAAGRRRVAGLRREEVATLAGISVDYVVRLEQGRGPHPSAQVLGALSRALRLNDAERAQVFELADAKLPHEGEVQLMVRASVQRLLERFADLPAMVVSAKGDILAWNPMAAALLGDYSRLPTRERNAVWQHFLGNPRMVMTPEEADTSARRWTGMLHAAVTAYPDDAELTRLVAELRRRSEPFEELWQQAPVATLPSRTKTIAHPEIGPITLDCESLTIPDSQQSLVVYSAEPGSEEAAKLDLLRVVGTQQMVSET